MLSTMISKPVFFFKNGFLFSAKGTALQEQPLVRERPASREKPGLRNRLLVLDQDFCQRPQRLPCGSMIAAIAPTPGIGIFGMATWAPSFVALSSESSMSATST